MKVLVTDGLKPEGRKVLLDAGLEVIEQFYEPSDLISNIGQFDAIIVRSATKVPREVIDAGINLKVIARAGVGIDNIDHQYAKLKDIPVANTPGASSISVAELAIGHMFALSRFLAESTNAMKDGEWPKKAYSKGVELTGKTLGIIGLGAIGKETAKRGQGLLMNVIAHDPFVREAPEGIELLAKEDLLSRSDYISLHVPYIKENGATISNTEFAQIKKGSILINCARGGVVDESALLKALNDGTVAAAAMDVFENEPPTEAQKGLIAHSNVSLSPHIGASTKEAQIRVGIEIAEKVVTHLKN